MQVKVQSWIVDELTLRGLRRGEAVSALMSEGGELWELSIGARKLLEYDARRATVLRAKETIRYWGPFVIVGGIVVAILGALWRRNEKSGYFSQFLAAALFLAIFGFFGWVVWTRGMEYVEFRRVLSNGVDAQALITGADSSGRGDYWLKVAWRDASGAELIDNRVAVTKKFLDKVMEQRIGTGTPLRIKYLVENGKPLAVACGRCNRFGVDARIELLFFAGLFCGGFLLFGRSTWRAWRMWRTTPGAGL